MTQPNSAPSVPARDLPQVLSIRSSPGWHAAAAMAATLGDQRVEVRHGYFVLSLPSQSPRVDQLRMRLARSIVHGDLAAAAAHLDGDAWQTLLRALETIRNSNHDQV